MNRLEILSRIRSILGSVSNKYQLTAQEHRAVLERLSNEKTDGKIVVDIVPLIREHMESDNAFSPNLSITECAEVLTRLEKLSARKTKAVAIRARRNKKANAVAAEDGGKK